MPELKPFHFLMDRETRRILDLEKKRTGAPIGELIRRAVVKVYGKKGK